VPLARSVGGVSITTDRTSPQWAGAHERSRRLAGVQVAMRFASPRRTVHGTAALDTVTRNVAWAIE
jgi:hypothetical protein